MVLFLFVFALGFLAFMAVVYLLAKLIFPRIMHDEILGKSTTTRSSHPRVSKKNPYSF